jgi:hypothetical protein
LLDRRPGFIFDLAHLPANALSERSRLIMTYALSGFANFGSLGIMIKKEKLRADYDLDSAPIQRNREIGLKSTKKG